MEISALTGGKPAVLQKEYFRKQAKARSILPPDVPALLPESSMAQLQKRMDAKVAAQRPLPGAKSSVDQDLVERQRGEMIARRAANTRVNFGAYDRERENIEVALDAQHKVQASKNIIQHTAERLALQKHLQGSHAELRGNQANDFRARIGVLTALIASNSAAAKAAGERALARQHHGGGIRMPARRMNPRFAMDTGYQYSRT